MKEHKKGQLMQQGVSFVVGIMVIGLVLGAGLLALDGFADSTSGTAKGAVNNATAGLAQVSSQLPTIGIMVGVGLLLLVVFIVLRFVVLK